MTVEELTTSMCAAFGTSMNVARLSLFVVAFHTRELVIGLSKLTRGTVQQRLALLFELYDVDGSGSVTVSELMRFVSRSGNDSNMELDQARQLLERLDADGDGSISRAEFLGQLTDSPVLLEAFTRSVAPTLVKKREVFRSLLNSSQAVPLDVLLSIWKDTPPEVRRSKVSRSGWRRWLLPQLSRNQIKGDAGPIANK